MGFIETPYRKVENAVVDIKGDPIYLSAEEEEDKLIAQASIPVDAKGKITMDKVIARQEGDFPVVDPTQVHYTDVAPNQISSISASLIPFLEHDDANRALMGSNHDASGRTTVTTRSTNCWNRTGATSCFRFQSFS